MTNLLHKSARFSTYMHYLPQTVCSPKQKRITLLMDVQVNLFDHSLMQNALMCICNKLPTITHLNSPSRLYWVMSSCILMHCSFSSWSVVASELTTPPTHTMLLSCEHSK